MSDIVIPAGKKKFIHVNRNRINSNRKHGLHEPTITVKSGKSNFYGRDVMVEGKMRLTQEECKLSCGARVYIITYGKVTVTK